MTLLRHLQQRTDNYRRQGLSEDLIAAAIVTVMLVPQSLAYALLAGLPPVVGVMASLLPLLAYAALGTSSTLAVGPVAVVAMMTAAATVGIAQTYGVSPHLAATVLAAEIGGVFLLGVLLRLDVLAALLSAPVLHGFMTGASLVIALGQLPALLGLKIKGNSLMEMWESVQHLNVGMTALAPHAATTAFGLLALLGLWLGRRYASAALRHLGLSPRMAQMLVRTVPMWVVILSCVTVAVLATHSTQTLEGVGLAGKIDLSTGFGFEAVWHAPLGLWRDLLLPAALIGLVAYVESLAVAESLAQKRGEKIVPRRELLGLGAANVVAGFSGAMPVTGGFSRSIVNFDAGARTRMAGVWTALFLAVAVLLVGQWLGLLPKAVLAATILIAVLSLLDFHPFQLAWKYARTELYLMMSVAAVTVIWGVEPALLLGVCCSVALLLKATARPHWAEVGRLSDTDVFRNVLRFEVQTQPHVMSIRIDESLVFTNTRWLIEMLNIKTAQNPALRHVVLMMTGVNQIDLTGLEGLMQLSTELKTRDVQLHFSELKGPVADKLQDANLPEWITGEVFRMQADAWRKLEQPP